MNKKSLLKTALVSATILSSAGLFANSAQAQAATSATHAEQVRGVLQVVDHENQGEVHLFDRDGHVMKQTVKNGKKYKVWEKAYINDELMYRIGTDKQWIPAKYTDWKDAKLGQNVAVTSQKTNSAVNRENYVGVATINYQGTGNVRLVNSQGSYTSQYLPKNSEWKVWEKADINHEPMYRVGNQSQWIPAKYVTVSSNNNKSVQNNANVHADVLGNRTTSSYSDVHESTQRPVNNSTHASKSSSQTNNAGSSHNNTIINSGSNAGRGTNDTSVKPTTPSKPANTKPVEPAKPAKPVIPSKPVTPTKPTDTKPVEPTTPTKPVEPNTSTDSKPVTPAKPANTKPVEPATPAKPVTPNKPAEPSKPVTPTQPTKPAEPATSTDNNQGLPLTNTQYEQLFWDNYMAPAGWQKGNVPITDYQVKNEVPDDSTRHTLGDWDSAYMQLYNGNYVNTPQSKAEFIQDASKLGNEYSWNDTSEYHKATIRATQPDDNSVRIDVLRYN